MEILVMYEDNRNDLTKILCKVWPNINKHLDRVYTYYAGPSKGPWDLFEELSDEIFIKSINDQIANGKDIIFLYNISEIMREPTIDKVHNCLPQLNIDPSKIYFVTGALDGPENYEKYCQSKGYTDRIKILAANLFLNVSKEQNSWDVYSEYIPKLRTKKFLCFNRVERKHRMVLVHKILTNNLIDTAYYSFYGNNFNSRWIDNITITENNRYDVKALELREDLKSYKHLFPLHLTADAKSRNNPISVDTSDIELFDNSYYSLVTETYFYADPAKDNLSSGVIPAMFFTEKIYKPISMKHPFILVSRANSLKWLRKFGFKTFSPYINESYDDETDDDTRMNMIVDEVKRLNQFTDSEWMDWQNNIKAIVDYNFQIYSSLTDYSYNPNQDLDF